MTRTLKEERPDRLGRGYHTDSDDYPCEKREERVFPSVHSDPYNGRAARFRAIVVLKMNIVVLLSIGYSDPKYLFYPLIRAERERR